MSRLFCLVAVVMGACGGRSEEPAAAPRDAGSDAMDAADAMDAMDAASACSPYPRSGCHASCGSSLTANAVCVDGEWQCPPDYVFYADCPLDSCVRTRGDCCNPTTGAISTSACGEDEKRMPCEDGTERIPDRTACIPDSLDVTDCLDLDGLACASAEMECNNSGGCRTYCRCGATDGGFVWHCVIPAC